jgi:hypothetical protein
MFCDDTSIGPEPSSFRSLNLPDCSISRCTSPSIAACSACPRASLSQSSAKRNQNALSMASAPSQRAGGTLQPAYGSRWPDYRSCRILRRVGPAPQSGASPSPAAGGDRSALKAVTSDDAPSWRGVYRSWPAGGLASRPARWSRRPSRSRQWSAPILAAGSPGPCAAVPGLRGGGGMRLARSRGERLRRVGVLMKIAAGDPNAQENVSTFVRKLCAPHKATTRGHSGSGIGRSLAGRIERRSALSMNSRPLDRLN